MWAAAGVVSRSDTPRRSEGVDFPTLLVTAAASAGAAFVTSQLWAPGTLAAAALTPVIVALLKEMLSRPVDVVTRAVPVRGVVRSATREGEPVAGAPPARQPYAHSPGEPRPTDTPEAIEARIAQLGEAPGASRRGYRRGWQVAVVTGLLGFVIAAVIITVPELVSGSSASGGGRDTTFFGGDSRSSKDDRTDTTTSPSPAGGDSPAPAETVTVPPPAETVTVPPPQTTIPEETPEPPAQTTPEQPATPAPGTPPPPRP